MLDEERTVQKRTGSLAPDFCFIYAAPVVVGGITGFAKAGSMPLLASRPFSESLAGLFISSLGIQRAFVFVCPATSERLASIVVISFCQSGKCMRAGLSPSTVTGFKLLLLSVTISVLCAPRQHSSSGQIRQKTNSSWAWN
uniref:Uncharacterized protein n=1 Tax=Peromyscus maniculatus bairdii TaxID=230844 RepID=A0A8C8W352_PERMB